MHYEVINPIIIGTLSSKYDAETPIEAAKQFWLKMSKIIVNEIPQSFFSLKDKNGKLYHFKVTEKRSSDNVADFMVTKYDQIDEKNVDKMSELYQRIKSATQTGGNHRHYDDDDDSSELEDTINTFNKINSLSNNHPIAFFHYIPSVYDEKSIFVPTFIYPYMPAYFEIGISSAFWKWMN